MVSRIFLTGFMGSGKTTLGRKLAKKLGYKFIDMDRYISGISGMTIPGIFSEYGEELFRKWESDVLKEIIKEEQVVVATGGGAPCHHDNMELMNQNGLTLYLRLTPESIRDRLVRSRNERPLIKGKSGKELLVYITELLQKREKDYMQSGLVVDGINPDVEQLVENIRTYRLPGPPHPRPE
ncbi:MAG: shikimate kinase [Bacteroidales bacterium]|nr:shikimate kinase [Bacteroidales bacterium]